jgi:CheY-like chemotaxis protein
MTLIIILLAFVLAVLAPLFINSRIKNSSLNDSLVNMKKAMAVLDYLDTMITVVDHVYNLVYINHSLAKKCGVDREASLYEKCYRVVRKRDTPCTICRLAGLLSDTELFPVKTYHDCWDDYMKMWFGGRVATIKWIDGSKVFLHSFYDETQKKTYERQLSEAVQKAEAASVAKSSFLANMSHEIRTPMNSIIGFSELAMDDGIPQKTREYLDGIMENSQWLLQIINDILDISKVESGNLALENIPFDLHEILVSCKSLIMPRVTEKNLELYFYAEPFIGRSLVGDPIRLRQVLINLLSNAVKFTNIGTVKLFVDAKDNENSGGKKTLRFEVKDSGIGMTAEQIEKIFDPFMQGDISTTRRYGGTGLGLTITKNLLGLMNSKLDVESTPGLGSKFSFELCFDTQETPDEDTETAKPAPQLKKPAFHGEVLVCEDNKMNQRVISEHLARVGLDVEIAENGREGIEKVRARLTNGEKPFDLIFMDIHMPVMDGIEAAPKIIALNTGTPIVAMTANVMAGDMESYLELGMEDQVGKPFTSQELWLCLLKYFKSEGFEQAEEADEEDEQLQRTLKAEFVNSNETFADEISGALKDGDIKLAHRLAHTLKSSAALIKKTGLQKAAAAVEAALKNGENRTSPEQMENLLSRLNTVLAELRPFLNESKNPGQADAAGFDTKRARELITKLKPLLKSGSPESLNFIEEIRFLPGSDLLIQQIDDFYFTDAAKTLAEIEAKL